VETPFKTFKLFPIGIEPYAEEADPAVVDHAVSCFWFWQTYAAPSATR
jgi:hypothetical protein